ncbi:MAG: hypothetical protein C4534_09905 [Gaiellales bacterium]|nr:MAG: hypothetical protein C4534_09905 [Gaiellales bacterium]
MAVGFILHRGAGIAEGQDPIADLDVTSGAASDNYGAAGEVYGATSDALGVPDDIYFTKPVDAVVFSHDTHVTDMGFKCDSCHSGLFEMKALSSQGEPDFDMAGLAEGKYCGACHSGEPQMAFASDTQCARCHVGVKGIEEE